jgi:hypothetical protein
MLGLYLLGLALGGFLIGRSIGRMLRPAAAYQFLQLGVAGTALSGLALFGFLPSAALLGFTLLGTSPWSIATINVIVAAVVILPPTIFIGASFPVATRLMESDRPRRGSEVGLALGLTTAGNVTGVLLTVLVLIPVAGLQASVAILVICNLAAAFVLWVVPRERAGGFRYLVPVGVLGGLAMIPALPSWDVSVMTSGVFRQAPVYLALLGSPERLERAFSAYRTRYYREGTEAVVGVFDRPTLEGPPHRVLTIDGKVDASTVADGRQFLRMTQERLDIIVSEPSNPWLSMSARLFTREFFRLVRDRLGARGVLVQWIPLYGLSSPQFAALLRTTLDVFPHLSLFHVAEGDLVAIAGTKPMSVQPSHTISRACASSGLVSVIKRRSRSGPISDCFPSPTGSREPMR